MPLAPVAIAVAVSGCGQVQDVAVTGAWVRLAAVPNRPAAGYFSLRGGATDQTLVAVASPAAGHIELHETVRTGRIITMAPVAQVPVPAGATVTFAPGGKHLMLFDVAAGATANPIPMTFTFASGKTVTIQAKAVAAGDPDPS